MNKGELFEVLAHLFPDHSFRWKRSPESAIGLCPFHEDRSPSLSLYKSKEVWRWWCHAEGIGGTAVNAVMRATGLSYHEANRWLSTNGYRPESEDDVKERERQEIYTKFHRYTNGLLINDPRALKLRAYIQSRSIALELLPKSAIGFYPSVEEVEMWLEANDVPDELRLEFIPKYPSGGRISASAAASARHSIIFFYRYGFDAFSCLKLRNVMKESPGEDKEVMMLGGTRNKTRGIGYFAPMLNYSRAEQALVVEGEFDAFAMYNISYRADKQAEEPVYCFGSGGQMERGIKMMMNLGVTDIYVFPDNDAPGMDYVMSIVVEHPNTYVIYPSGDYEDPAEWATKHAISDLQQAYSERISAPIWFGRKLAEKYNTGTPEDEANVRAKLVEYARRLTPTGREKFLGEFAPIANVTAESLMEEVTDNSDLYYKANYSNDKDRFGIYMKVREAKGFRWEHISNFIIEITHDVMYDDGAGWDMERKIMLRMSLHNEVIESSIMYTDFADYKRFEQFIMLKMGSKIWIKAGHTKFVYESAQLLSNAAGTRKEDETVCRHTGWRDGKYYMPNGCIDADGFHSNDEISVRVELPNTMAMYNKYFLVPPHADIETPMKVVREGLFKAFPYYVTLTAFAHFMQAPLRYFFPESKATCLWIYGLTGSMKTTYTGIMSSLYGDFVDGKSFQSWQGSTQNSIEKNGFYLKDAIYVIDDYKPISIKPENLVTLIQNYGNGMGKSRMTASLETQKIFPIRGLMVSTAEDIPTGEASVIARTIQLHVPSKPNTEAMTLAAESASLYPGLFSKWVQHIINLNIDPRKSGSTIRRYQAKFQGEHQRVNESLAMNAITWDLLSDFFNLHDLDDYYYEGLNIIGGTMAHTVAGEKASNEFIAILCELLGTKNYYFQGKDGVNSTEHNDNAKLLGWVTRDELYLLGRTALAEANSHRYRTFGSSLRYSVNALYDQLINDGYAIAGRDKSTVQIRVDGTRQRVLRLRKDVLLNDDSTYTIKVGEDDGTVVLSNNEDVDTTEELQAMLQ